MTLYAFAENEKMSMKCWTYLKRIEFVFMAWSTVQIRGIFMSSAGVIIIHQRIIKELVNSFFFFSADRMIFTKVIISFRIFAKLMTPNKNKKDINVNFSVVGWRRVL